MKFEKEKVATGFSASREMLSRIRASRVLFLPLLARKRKEKNPSAYFRLPGEIDIVIEDCFQSIDPKALSAFRRAQPANIRIITGSHAAAVVKQAVRQNIPTIIFIRKPEDAIASDVMTNTESSLLHGVIEYCRFHTHIEPYRGGFVIADTESKNQGFNTAIGSINKRFGAQFRQPELPDPENRRQKNKDTDKERERRQRKEKKLRELLHTTDEIQPRLQKAYELYYSFRKLIDREQAGKS